MDPIIIPSKWIVAGEHAVLRGGMAIAIPNHKHTMTFEFSRESAGFRVEPPDLSPVVLLLIQDLAQELHENLAQKPVDSQNAQTVAPLSGVLTIRSSIPLGAGLGSSAALAVGVCRWLESEGRLSFSGKAQLATIATRLEHQFHGKSSGIDVATVAFDCPIVLENGLAPREFVPQWIPNVTLHDTGFRSSTRACIDHVSSLVRKEPLQVQLGDEKMAEAVTLALQALGAPLLTPERRFEALAASFHLSTQAFAAYGLLTDEITRQMDALIAQGARAVRLTGSGRGGMIAAIWKN